MACTAKKRNKLKITKGDLVVVLTGKDKGKRGKVIKVLPSKMKVLVEGINIAIKHFKPSQALPEGGRLTLERPIHYSNLLLVDPKADLPTKIGYKILEDGTKVRYARRSGEIIYNKADK